mmetsp:Transcript_25396/g.29003  ORF Transcript_25396/g.29003 Transcript_25396/m.29003 type:complete len:82 (-) Transcript_25396:66-311(-)
MLRIRLEWVMVVDLPAHCRRKLAPKSSKALIPVPGLFDSWNSTLSLGTIYICIYVATPSILIVVNSFTKMNSNLSPPSSRQ